MSVDRPKATGHEYECTSRRGVGGSDPGSLAGLRDAEGGSDVQTAAHTGAEREHGYEVGQDQKDGDCGLTTLRYGGGRIIWNGCWRGRPFLRRCFSSRSGCTFEMA